MRPILPCNDPLRPEWGIFSDLLGHPVTPDPGSTPETAAQALKSTLFEAFGRDAPGFVVKMLHRRGDDRSPFIQLRREAAAYPGGWPAMQDEIAQRLVAPMDGAERLIMDEDLGSSYNALAYWQPEQGGLVPYMRQRIKWALHAMNRERAQSAAIYVSLNALNAVGIDIDENGKVIRQTLDEWQPCPDGKVPDAAGLLRRAQAAVLPGVGRSRPEYAFFSALMGREIIPADSPAARIQQLKAEALNVDRHIRGGLGDEKTEKLLLAWEPNAASFRYAFPKLSAKFDAVLEAQNPGAPKRDAVPIPSAEFAAVERLAAQPNGSHALVRLAKAAQHFWTARATNEAELANSTRPDYEYLSLVTGRTLDLDPPPMKLFAAVGEMAKQWAETAMTLSEGRLAGRVTALRRAVAAYDPSRDGFLGEYLRDPQVWKDPAAPCPLPEITAMQGELFCGEASANSWPEPTMG